MFRSAWKNPSLVVALLISETLIVTGCGDATTQSSPMKPQSSPTLPQATGPQSSELSHGATGRPASPRGSFVFISDLDDTVKVSEVSNPFKVPFRAFFGNQSFSAMGRFFSSWSTRQSAFPPVFVSGSPVFLEDHVRGFFRDGGFPARYELNLKPSLFANTASFKIQQISTQMADHRDAAGFILMGDDGEADPETYDAIRKINPERIDAIYIHRVAGREIPEGQIPFDTALDVAALELRAGRLDVEQALAIGNEVLNERVEEALVMSYHYCPLEGEPRLSEMLRSAVDPRVAELQRRVEDRIREICAERERDRTEKPNWREFEG